MAKVKKSCKINKFFVILKSSEIYDETLKNQYGTSAKGKG